MRVRSLAGRTTRATTAGALCWLGGSTAYLLVLLGMAARGVSPPDTDVTILPTVTLVPAHDEELAIGGCVRSLLAQDVGREMHRVVVIADNCTDATGRRAAAAGATVWERVDDRHRGKGQALVWGLARLRRELADTAVVGVVDADCLVGPELCRAWSRALAGGAGAAQADYAIDNASESRAAARRWAGFALKHRIRATGKQRLGLSVGLFGTGMAFSRELLDDVPWTSVSVTEDAEYHVQIVTAGHRVAFVGDTVVRTPAPTSERAAQTQQLRWETGNVALLRRSAARLLWRGLRDRRAQDLHLGLEQLVPPQSLLAAATITAALVAFGLGDRRLGRLAAGVLAGQALFVLGGLAVAQAPAPVWRALVTAPALVVRKLGQLGRIASGRGARTWERTAR